MQNISITRQVCRFDFVYFRGKAYQVIDLASGLCIDPATLTNITLDLSQAQFHHEQAETQWFSILSELPHLTAIAMQNWRFGPWAE